MSKKRSLSSLEQSIIDLLKTYPDASIPIPLLADGLHLKSRKGSSALKKAIKRLAHLGLIQIGRNQLVRLKPAEIREVRGVIGKLDVNSRGTGYVIVEDREQDIKIPGKYMSTALDGDLVRVTITGEHHKSHQPMGKIVEIVERAGTLFVGTLIRQSDKSYLIESDLKSSRMDFFVDPEGLKGAKPGDKVSFRLKAWEDVRAYPEAEIVASLGKAGSNEASVLSILAEKQFQAAFPADVERDASRYTDVIPEEEIARRRDLRGEVVLTIDPFDAKDFDDALSIRPLKNGNMELGVHIADVTYYLEQGSALDQEGYRRGTSVYLVDRVIPMLPEHLSNGLCSLRPNEDKLTYSCFMEIDHRGEVLDHSIEETIIHSKQRFTYEEVQQILDGNASHRYQKQLRQLEKLANNLLAKREREGSIQFETPEPKFVLDESGKPTDVIVKERLFAHRLIEECMLAANKTVAKHVDSMRKDRKNRNDHPFLYRIHDRPDKEKLQNIKETAKQLGLHFELNGTVTPAKINALLQEVESTPIENIINGLMLRAMAKAVYSPKNIGHFGLSFADYTHFTSPIRRYPDVIVHRLLKSYAKGRRSYTYDELTRDGEYCSERERYAVEAERDSVKLKQVEFLSERIGEVFHGVISGVTENGIYVMINEIYCEGMVRVRDMKDDYYLYNPQMHWLMGRSKGKRYRLGDSVTVHVEQTDIERRLIDLLLV